MNLTQQKVTLELTEINDINWYQSSQLIHSIYFQNLTFSAFQEKKNLNY